VYGWPAGDSSFALEIMNRSITVKISLDVQLRRIGALAHAKEVDDRPWGRLQAQVQFTHTTPYDQSANLVNYFIPISATN
jgi:hypothetical protein